MGQIAELANGLRKNVEGVLVVPGGSGGVDVKEFHAGEDGVEADEFVGVGEVGGGD